VVIYLDIHSYGAIVAAFAFVVLSLGGLYNGDTCINSDFMLASGLLWISELIEENTRTAKVVGKRSIYVRSRIYVVSDSLNTDL
jgi:hypothetical protein